MSQWTTLEQQLTSDMDIVLSCSSLKISKVFQIHSLLEISYIWEDSHSKSMMKASKPEITQQLIVHGPCYMVMSKIKILLNINFQKLSSISINKNTPQWKKTLEISDNLPEDFWVNTQFCWPFQPVSTQKIKISLFKSLEKMNKEFLELGMEKDN